MNRLEVRRAVGCLLSIAILSTPLVGAAQSRPAKKPAAPATPPAPAKPKPLSETLQDAAKTEYLAGKLLFEDGDFATALQKFKSAYARQPEARLLFNIAATEKNLRHYTKAAKLFRQCLVEAGDLLSPEERKETDDLLRVIDELTIAFSITVSEPGAQVFIDDELIGVSPFGSQVPLDIGQRKFRVQKEGFRTLNAVVQIGPVKEMKFRLEPQRARLELTIPPSALVMLDEKPLGKGPLLQVDDLPVGGHALRITAPRMRPYQGEVVLEDGKTRILQIDLEADLEQLSEIRVAVGCADPRIRTPEEGLTVFFDDSTVSASPLGVRKRVEGDKEVPAYVPFTVPTGAHRVRLRYPGCDPLETNANAASASSVDVTGMLPPEQPWFNGTPAGSPNGFRVTAGVTFGTLSFDRYQNFFDTLSASNNTTKARVDVAGASASVGLQTRWLMGVIDARYVVGSTSGKLGVVDTNSSPMPTVTNASQTADLSLWDAGLRIGPRIPFNIASVSAGVLAGAGVLHVVPSGDHNGEKTASFVRGGGWAALEAQPLCDFSLGLQFSFSGVSTGGPDVGASTESAWSIHLGYQPNVLCRRKRGGLYRVDADGAAPPKAPTIVAAPSAAAPPAPATLPPSAPAPSPASPLPPPPAPPAMPDPPVAPPGGAK